MIDVNGVELEGVLAAAYLEGPSDGASGYRVRLLVTVATGGAGAGPGPLRRRVDVVPVVVLPDAVLEVVGSVGSWDYLLELVGEGLEGSRVRVSGRLVRRWWDNLEGGHRGRLIVEAGRVEVLFLAVGGAGHGLGTLAGGSIMG